MAQGAVATAVAGKLVEHVADLDRLLVDVNLPGVAEVLAGQLRAGEDRRQGAHFERGGGVIGGNIVGRVGPLRIAGRGDGKDGQTRTQRRLIKLFMANSLPFIVDRNRNSAETALRNKIAIGCKLKNTNRK